LITIVDTSVWSIALRRSKDDCGPQPAKVALRKMVTEGQPIGLPGIVLQELLSGVRSDVEFERLRSVLAPFNVVYATEEHHIEAARIFNRCRTRGITTSTPDALIAATAMVENGKLLTCDRDFAHIATVVDLRVEMVEVTGGDRGP
jgi:predicted nucleic acid-binding protein